MFEAERNGLLPKLSTARLRQLNQIHPDTLISPDAGDQQVREWLDHSLDRTAMASLNKTLGESELAAMFAGVSTSLETLRRELVQGIQAEEKGQDGDND